MRAMNELRIEGVRCFRDEQRIPIRPVTLLVGENSAGKSTVLAMVRAAWDVAFGSTEPDFNEQPFDLGGFDAIAHHQGGRRSAPESSRSVASSPYVVEAKASLAPSPAPSPSSPDNPCCPPGPLRKATPS
jgi:predicted ATPase